MLSDTEMSECGDKYAILELHNAIESDFYAVHTGIRNIKKINIKKGRDYAK